MDEAEFRRLLNRFPVVRSRSYCADDEPSRTSSLQAGNDELTQWQDAWNQADLKKEDQEIDINDPFWEKLRLAAETKVSSTEAEKFCKAFQVVHKKLVYETMSSDSAEWVLHDSGRC